MKTKSLIIWFLIIVAFIWIWVANAVTCFPTWDWSWIVNKNCSYPDWYKVYWDIVVWKKIINMWSNNNIWIDLNHKK